MFEDIPDAARPSASTSALITIDVQDDFVRAGAPAEIPGTQDVIPSMVKLLSAYRRAGRPIIHVVRLYAPDGSDGELSRRARLAQGPTIAAPGSKGAQLVAELRPEPEQDYDDETIRRGELATLGDREWVMYKSRWSAFYDTPLLAHLQGLGVDSIVVCGCNFPNCPRATVVDATERDLRAVIAMDAVSRFEERDEADMLDIGVAVEAVVDLDRWLEP